MQERLESSVLFSLEELMAMERQRVAGENAALELRGRAEADRARAEVAARRQEEVRRQAEELERQQAQQLRRQEEEARLAAIKEAELWKAHAEAAEQARLQRLLAQQRHEQELAVLIRDSGRRRLKVLVALIGGLLVTVVALGGLAFSAFQKDAQRRHLEAEAQTRELAASTSQLEREKATAEATAVALQRDLAGERLRRERERAHAKQDDPTRRIGLGRPALQAAPSVRPNPPKPCTCAQGDPICDCPD